MEYNLFNFNNLKYIILTIIIGVVIFEMWRILTDNLDVGNKPYKFFAEKFRDPIFKIELFLIIIIYTTVLFYKISYPNNKEINKYFKAVHIGLLFLISITMAHLSLTTTQFFLVAFFFIVFQLHI